MLENARGDAEALKLVEQISTRSDQKILNKFSDHDLSNPQFIQQKRSITEQDEKALNDILGKMGVKEASPDKDSATGQQ